MPAGYYAMQGLLSAGEGIAGAIDKKKENEQLDRQLTQILKAYQPELDQTGMNLADKQGMVAGIEAKNTVKRYRQEARARKAEIAQRQAATAASQAQVGIAQENQRYLNHQRDMAAEAQAGEARYLKPYADVAGSQAPGLMNNQAYSRYRETQQNPNLAAAARYMAQTGQVPTGDVMSRYMPQAQAPQDPVEFIQAPNGQTIARLGKTMQALPNQQASAPREIQLIEALQRRGYSPDEAEKKAIELLGRGLSPAEQMMLSLFMGDAPGATPGINNDPATGRVPPPRQ